MSLNCPECNCLSSSVLYTRSLNNTITRRRECVKGHRFTTLEVVVKNTRSGLRMPPIELNLKQNVPVKQSHAPTFEFATLKEPA